MSKCSNKPPPATQNSINGNVQSSEHNRSGQKQFNPVRHPIVWNSWLRHLHKLRPTGNIDKSVCSLLKLCLLFLLGIVFYFYCIVSRSYSNATLYWALRKYCIPSFTNFNGKSKHIFCITYFYFGCLCVSVWSRTYAQALPTCNKLALENLDYIRAESLFIRCAQHTSDSFCFIVWTLYEVGGICAMPKLVRFYAVDNYSNRHIHILHNFGQSTRQRYAADKILGNGC